MIIKIHNSIEYNSLKKSWNLMFEENYSNLLYNNIVKPLNLAVLLVCVCNSKMLVYIPYLCPFLHLVINKFILHIQLDIFEGFIGC